MIVIEMNPRVSRSQRPGEQGDRVPDRQDRRQARRRLPARRDPQRHHPRDPRLLRADDRLRRHQDPALGVREVPRRRPGPDHADEVGRRGDGDRPDVPRVVPEGPARAGGRPVRPRLRQEGPLGDRPRSRPRTRSRPSSPRPTPSGSGTSATRCSPGCRSTRSTTLTGIDPWFLANLARAGRSSKGRLRAGRQPRGGGRRRCSARPSGTASPTASSPTSGALTEARGPPRPASGGGSRPSSSWSTPAPPSSRRSRRTTTRPTRTRTRPASATKPRVVILGGGPEPDRPGDRVRLLLLPGRLRPAGRRLRGRHGQLEPRDRQHRLRHLRPPLLRAPDGRGRAQRLRAGQADGGDRPVRRPDPAEPGPGARGGRRADHRHEPREHRPGRGPRAVPPGHRPARPASRRPTARRRDYDEARRIAERIGYPVVVRPELRAGRPRDGDRLRRVEPRPLHDRGRRGQPRAPGPDRQVPRRRQRGRRRRRLRRRPGRSSAA